MANAPSSLGPRRFAVKKSSVRDDRYSAAVDRLLGWIEELGSNRKTLAREIGVSASTLDNLINHRHKRAPHKPTLNALLNLGGLPKDLREMLLDVRDFDSRVMPTLLRGSKTTDRDRPPG